MADLDLTRYEGHTPGPWSVYDQGVDDGPEYGAHIQSADPMYDWVVQDITNRADARLIADAPLLLAEVKRLRDENKTFRAAQKSCEDCDAPTAAQVEALRQSHARLLAAINTSAVKAPCKLPDCPCHELRAAVAEAEALSGE